MYRSLSHLLRKEHGEDSLTGFPKRKMTEENLLRSILTNNEFEGFVTIRGGAETRLDLPSLVQGFCLEKFNSSEDPVRDLGEYAVEMTRLDRGVPSSLTKEEVQERLRKNCKNRNLTMTRLSFHPNQVTTMSCDYLRFLVMERKFVSFEVVHFIHYEKKSWLFDLIFKVLQERQSLKKGKADPLGEQTCKLYLNSVMHTLVFSSFMSLPICMCFFQMYGHTFKETTSFTNTSIVSQSTCLEKKVAQDPNLVSCSLLGTRPTRGRRTTGRTDRRCRPKSDSKRPKSSQEEMVFAISRRAPNSRICNIAQIAAQESISKV